MMSATGRHKIVRVTITRLEGRPHEVDRPETYTTLREANARLHAWSYGAPEAGSYDKVRFEVQFTDGAVYTGRYDLQYGEYPDLARHIRDHLQYMAGQAQPWTEEQQRSYEAYIRSLGPDTVREAQRWLEEYDIRDSA